MSYLICIAHSFENRPSVRHILTNRSILRVAVYLTPPILVLGLGGKYQEDWVWFPISWTLIYSSAEAVLVDTSNNDVANPRAEIMY